MYIGEKIAAERRKNNMTQRELAERLNVSDKVISKWETGKSLPDVETMLCLSKVLGITISELYEAVEKNDTMKIESYSEERVWAYKKYSIVSWFLIVMSPLFILLADANWTGSNGLQDIFEFILIIASIVSLVLGLAFQISQFIRLYSFCKTKFYQDEYHRVLKKYGILTLAFLLAPILLVLGYFVLYLFNL